MINPGGVVQSGFGILAGQTLPFTAADSDQTCTATLTAQEPNTASLSCECQFATGPLIVQAQDSARVSCLTEEGCPTSFVGFDGVTLGAAGNFTVLVLDSPRCSSEVTLSAPATKIEGDVGVAISSSSRSTEISCSRTTER